jgi:nicotinamidase-related amidase
MPAVIIIDLQTCMFDGVAFGPLHDYERLVANANRLADWARGSGFPLAYVRHDGQPGEHIARGAAGWPIYPAVAPKDGEPIFEKSVGDSFSNPDLGAWLRERKVDDVILAGAQTDECINATCRGALANGFAVTIASDAHSTVGWNGETAAQIIDRHNKLFAELGARVETVEGLVGGR